MAARPSKPGSSWFATRFSRRPKARAAYFGSACEAAADHLESTSAVLFHRRRAALWAGPFSRASQLSDRLPTNHPCRPSETGRPRVTETSVARRNCPRNLVANPQIRRSLLPVDRLADWLQRSVTGARRASGILTSPVQLFSGRTDH